jgi:hypothetical protein
MYSSPNIISVIKLMRMSWAGHVVRMEETRNQYRILVWNLKERDYLGDLGVDGETLLR